MKMEKKHTVNIKDIFEEYKENQDIFNEEEDNIINLKRIIWNVLDETERRIILLYTEIGNMRDTAKELGVSTSTLCIYVNKIRQKIKDNL